MVLPTTDPTLFLAIASVMLGAGVIVCLSGSVTGLRRRDGETVWMTGGLAALFSVLLATCTYWVLADARQTDWGGVPQAIAEHYGLESSHLRDNEFVVVLAGVDTECVVRTTTPDHGVLLCNGAEPSPK